MDGWNGVLGVGQCGMIGLVGFIFFIGVVLFGLGCGGGGGWFSSFVGLNVYGTSKKYAYHYGILVAHGHFQCLNMKKSCLIDKA